jgi:hypothetical protein
MKANHPPNQTGHDRNQESPACVRRAKRTRVPEIRNPTSEIHSVHPWLNILFPGPMRSLNQ